MKAQALVSLTVMALVPGLAMAGSSSSRSSSSSSSSSRSSSSSSSSSSFRSSGSGSGSFGGSWSGSGSSYKAPASPTSGSPSTPKTSVPSIPRSSPPSNPPPSSNRSNDWSTGGKGSGEFSRTPTPSVSAPPSIGWSTSGKATGSFQGSNPKPYKVTPPSSSQAQDSYKSLAPSNSAQTKTRNNSNGSQTHEYYDRSGKFIGRSTIAKDGTVVRHTNTNADGSTTTTDYKRGVQKTVSEEGGNKRIVTKNLLTGQSTERTTDVLGNQTVYVSRGNNTYTYHTSSRTLPNSTTVIHEYHPYSNYNSDFWFYMWLMQSMNHGGNSQPSSGGYAGGGNYANIPSSSPSISLPRQIDFNWSSQFPDLPKELLQTKTYQDPSEWISDFVVFDMISEMRKSSLEKRQEIENDKCWRFAFWCSNPEPPYTEDYLSSLANYNLDYNLRTELHAHTVEVLTSIKDGKTVSIADIINDDNSEVKSKRLYILNDGLDTRSDETQDICSLDAGDVVRLKAHYPGTDKVSVEVVRLVDQDEDSCPVGRTVSMTASDLQDLENEFANRIDMASSQSKKLLREVRH